jgi:protein-S-isoprenylcysteine O-methyltransferase Ste14
MSEPRKPDVPESKSTTDVSPANRDRPASVPWPPILLVAVIILASTFNQLIPIPWPGQKDIAARVIGLAIGAGGIVLAAWSISTMHRANTTIKPHRGSDHLVTNGPFKRFRNPIYLADVMVLLGLAEFTKNIWFVAAAALFGVLVTWLAILPEERYLESRFGDAYSAYKARSRRWL